MGGGDFSEDLVWPCAGAAGQVTGGAFGEAGLSAPVHSLSPKIPQPSVGMAAAELAGWQDSQRMGR